MLLLLPAIPHAVLGSDLIELGVNVTEFITDSANMGGNSVVGNNNVGRFHQLVVIFHMTRPLCQAEQDPEFGEGQADRLPLPEYFLAVFINSQPLMFDNCAVASVP